jgi:hypothetical protein
MPTIHRTYTTTTEICIQLPITSETHLARTLQELGSHYLSADTRRFFGSRILEIWPTPDGAIWTETTKGPRDGSQRWTYAKRIYIRTQEQIDDGHGTHHIADLYKDQGDASPRTARARATAAARAAYNAAKVVA